MGSAKESDTTVCDYELTDCKIVFTRVLRKTEPTVYMEIYERRFIIGIASCGYGGWEAPQFAACSWRTSKASGLIPPIPMAQESGADSVEIPVWVQISEEPECQYLKAGKGRCLSSSRKSITHSLHFVLFRPSTGWIPPVHTDETNLLYSVYPFHY